MLLPISQVDAFTNERFKGNPAAVVPLEQWLSDAQMQAIAAENNLSETAFFVREPDGAFHIRWFSPLTEIDFCGHATLASAFVILEQRIAAAPLTFRAAAVGDIEVTLRDDGLLEMSFPNR
ncbi:MAG TPA: phenazine biosynthesis protein PhzF, partial [Pseudomonas sp.]|nr:phenazine biosynthesis protein PhzF [Pseudomonas sp.]